MIIFLLITSFFIIVHIFLFHMFPTKPLRKHQHFDVCIVLGSPSSKDGTCTRMQKSRMDRAIQLYRDHIISYIIISGGSVLNTYCEAITMKTYALLQGIPDSTIILEKKAANSYENLLYAKSICTKHKFSSIVVVTSNFHIRRASFFTHKFFHDYAMAGTLEKEKPKHYILEYFKLWNTLWIEWKNKRKK